MQTTLRHGTVVTTSSGRLRKAVDRHGNEAWAVRWNGDALHAIVLQRPDRSQVVVEGAQDVHPLFRAAQSIKVAEQVLARCGAIDWCAPTSIPPVDVPAALPSGAGSAILNWLAGAATRTGTPALRYRGPYPTAALFDSLTHSFRVADPTTALERFTADVESRAIGGAMTEVDVPFQPAPFEWHWPTPQICVQLREGLERVYIDGRGYALHQRGTRRLRREGDTVVAYIELGGRAWHDVLSMDLQGTPLGDAAPLRAAPPRLLGQSLPEEIVALLGQMLGARAPVLLRPQINACLQRHVIVWGDTGDDAARAQDGRIELHSALGEMLPELDPHVALSSFVLALEPVVARIAQANTA